MKSDQRRRWSSRDSGGPSRRRRGGSAAPEKTASRVQTKREGREGRGANENQDVIGGAVQSETKSARPFGAAATRVARNNKQRKKKVGGKQSRADEENEVSALDQAKEYRGVKFD